MRASKGFRVNAKLVNKDTGNVDVAKVRLSLVKEDLIGNGRFGLVFRVRLKRRLSDNLESSTPRKLALKIVSVRRKGCRELSLLRKLDHPNIIKLHFFFFSAYSYIDENSKQSSQDLCCHLLTDLMPISLYSMLRSHGPLAEMDVLVYFRQMIEALSYLHEREICHRDLKPANVLVDPQSQDLKICDFGSAIILSYSGCDERNSYICSRYYRAPELILGTGRYDLKVDIWSLGCILGDMLAGEPIFASNSSMGQIVEMTCLLGHLDSDTLYEMGSVVPYLEDGIVSFDLNCSVRSRLADRFHIEENSLIMDLLLSCLNYVPRNRASSQSLIEQMKN